MKLGPYNGFTGEGRVKADRKIKIAVELGLIPKAKTCSSCDSKSGRIDHHAENYGRSLQITQVCQMALHNRLRGAGYAESWKKRVSLYADGTK